MGIRSSLIASDSSSFHTKMKILVTIVCLALYFASSDAQIYSFGQCNTAIQGVQNFDAASFAGLWFEISKYPNTFQSGNCATQNITVNADGSLTIRNAEFGPILGLQRVVEFTGQLTQASQGRGEIIAGWDLLLPIQEFFNPNGNYIVLSTDYSSFATIYSCRNGLLGKWEYLWVLGRERSLNVVQLATISAGLVVTGLNPLILELSDQT